MDKVYGWILLLILCGVGWIATGLLVRILVNLFCLGYGC